MGKIGQKQNSAALWQDASLFQPKSCQVVAGVRLSTIRRANRHDAKQLSLLAEWTFRETFDGMNTPENMALHCRTSYSEAIQADEISDPNMVTLLCECEERLVGFAQLRWGDAPSCVAANAPGEIQRLYVISDCHAKGVARELMNACIDEMRDRRSDVVWLGVWERNPRAITFYKKFGFVEVGDHVFPLGSDPQRDIVMARTVADGSPSA
jgi:ribosomal protein S18 acetylase RimI-like enzyme